MSNHYKFFIKFCQTFHCTVRRNRKNKKEKAHRQVSLRHASTKHKREVWCELIYSSNDHSYSLFVSKGNFAPSTFNSILLKKGFVNTLYDFFLFFSTVFYHCTLLSFFTFSPLTLCVFNKIFILVKSDLHVDFFIFTQNGEG